VLIFSDGAEQRVVAEATTSSDLVSVQLLDEPVTADLLPESVLHHVLRTRESVILDDATQSPFGADPYIRRQQPRSVLCLPLLNQAKVIAEAAHSTRWWSSFRFSYALRFTSAPDRFTHSAWHDEILQGAIVCSDLSLVW
jgi:hypothetical protein